MPVSLVGRSGERIYGLVLAGLLTSSSVPGLLPTESYQLTYFFIQLLALGIGLIHVRLGSRFRGEQLNTGEVGTVLFVLLVAALLAVLLYYLLDSLASRWPFITALLSFTIPTLVGLAYTYYRQIPDAVYTRWYYPSNGEAPDLDLLDLSKILVIQFEFRKKPDDALYTNFKAKAPVAMTLGELFLVFINDYNERTPEQPIVYTDAASQSYYGWVFYKKAAWWQRRRYLDPNLNFTQNQLGDNDTLIASRVN